LYIEDNGIGIPEKINVHNPKTLGLSIVHMLAEEMEFRTSVMRERGTKFLIEMPISRLQRVELSGKGSII
jgi:hypothetical protein